MKHKDRVALVNVNRKCKEVLSILKLDEVLKIADSFEDAEKMLS
jgi:hypothetical protein